MLASLFLAAGAAAGEKGTVTGEVIDSACYIKGGSRGADHAKRAAGCAKMGIPLALVTDDRDARVIQGDGTVQPGHVVEPRGGSVTESSFRPRMAG